MSSSSFLVTARRFRPQTFASIVGQEHVTKALENAILRNRIPHALLFTGPRGVGKTSCARVLSKALNCTGRAQDSIEPCGECQNCREIAKSVSLAVREIDGASNNSVENVRELIESLRSLPPPGSTWKIYIIDEVHMLSTAAFNALLKSLEEPPPHTVFIFATTEPHKIPETVISRCQRHDFRSLPIQTIIEQLSRVATEDGLAVNDAALGLIARKAQGGMRDAQSMFDRVAVFSEGKVDLPTVRRVLGLIDSEFFFRLSEAIFEQKIDLCFELLDSAFSQSHEIRAFVADFLVHWRALLLTKLSQAKVNAEVLEISEDERQNIIRLVASRDAFTLQQLFDLALEIGNDALESNFPRYVFEAGIARMATLPELQSLSEILTQMGNAPARSAEARPTGAAERRAAPAAKIAPPNTSAPINETLTRSSAFNPSWQDFVSFVKGRGKIVLASHLHRVSPKVFRRGELQVEGGSFDVDALRAGEHAKSLDECLNLYSGESKWNVQLAKVAAKPATEGIVDGSLAQKQVQDQKENRERVNQEARELPAVQSVLETFSGSKIEKVSVIEK